MAAKRRSAVAPAIRSKAVEVASGANHDRLIGALLVVSAWSSFVALPLPTGSNTGRVFAVWLAAAAWLAAVAFGRFAPALRGRRGFTISVAALAAAILVSSAASPYAARALTWGSLAFFGAPMWAALALIAICASWALRGDRWRGAVAASVGWVVPSLAIAAYQVASGLAVSGGFNTGNHFGALMVAACGPLAWLAATAEGSERRAWAGLAAGCALGVIVSGSAAALLGLVVAAACAAIVAPGLFGPPGSGVRRLSRIAVLGVAGVFTAVVVLGIVAPGALPDRAAAYVRGDVLGTTFQTRVEMWKAAGEVFRARPLTGYGADSYHLAAQPYLSRRLFQLEHGKGLLAVPPDPHSLPLLFAAQFGAIGLLAGLVVLVMWARTAFVPDEGEDAVRVLLRRCAAASAIGFLVTMLFVPWAAVLGAFPAVLAGLAVARADAVSAAAEGDASSAGKRDAHAAGPAANSPAIPAVRVASAIAALGFAALALMLLSGLVSLRAAEDAPSAPQAQKAYNRMASAMPTYPYARLMSLHAEGSQLGGSGEALAAWQRRVDADPAMRQDATYALMLARDSLDQAYRWGRSDVVWETTLLDDAAKRFPNAPDLPIERAHAAVLAGDAAEATRLLDSAEKTAFGESRLDLYRYYVAVLQRDASEAARLRAQLEPEYGPKALLDPQTTPAP